MSETRSSRTPIPIHHDTREPNRALSLGYPHPQRMWAQRRMKIVHLADRRQSRYPESRAVLVGERLPWQTLMVDLTRRIFSAALNVNYSNQTAWLAIGFNSSLVAESRCVRREITHLASSTRDQEAEVQVWAGGEASAPCATSEATWEASAASERAVHPGAVSFGVPMASSISDRYSLVHPTPELRRGALCELLNQVAWGRRRLQLLVRRRHVYRESGGATIAAPQHN